MDDTPPLDLSQYDEPTPAPSSSPMFEQIEFADEKKTAAEQPVEDNVVPTAGEKPEVRNAGAVDVEKNEISEDKPEPEEEMVEKKAPSEASRAMLAFPDGSEVYIDKDEFVIGRGKKADVEVNGKWIKKRHAVIRRLEDGGWTISDKGRMTRVGLNDENFREAPLNNNDAIVLGDMNCLFIVIDA